MQEQLFCGEYSIIRLLGIGGTGAVYLALSVKLGTKHAIKVVNKDKVPKLNLFAEPNILKKLNHPAFPRISNIIEDQENVYIIEDYVEGAALDKELKRLGNFPERTVINWAKQICEILLYLHTLKPNPIIYRDMKPANIIITGNNRIKIVDFGIAVEYEEGRLIDEARMGTRGYAAPEQYRKSLIDQRTDIYGLGATLYHLLTGISPGEKSCGMKPLRQTEGSISKGMERLILKCTRIDPRQRYQSIKEVYQELINIEKLNRDYKMMEFCKYIKNIFSTRGRKCIEKTGTKDKNEYDIRSIEVTSVLNIEPQVHEEKKIKSYGFTCTQTEQL